jgi:hypothetical protein
VTEVSVQDVRSALVELYRESVQVLKGRDLHVFPKTRFVIDDSTFHMEEEDDFAWDLLVEEGAEVLTPLESFRVVRQWLESEPVAARHLNKMVGIDESRHGITVLNCISSFLAELYEEAGGLKFDEAAVQAKASEFVDFFTRETIEFDCVALVENFECQRDRVELGDGLALERWSVERRSDLLELMETSLSLHDTSTLMRDSQFVLRLKTEEAKVIHEQGDTSAGGTESSRRVHKRFSAACVALSIYGKARIRYHDLSRVATSWVPGGRSFHPSSSGGDPLIGGRQREFSEEEIEGFLQFWPRFLSVSEALRVGIRWLDHLLCSPGTHEDHVIRATVVLESTLLHGDQHELKYRLRLRGARLLSERARKLTYALLGLLYDLRSQIIHEGGQLPQKIRVEARDLYRAQFVDEIVGICRDVVVRLVNLESEGVCLAQALARLDEDALMAQATSSPEE